MNFTVYKWVGPRRRTGGWALLTVVDTLAEAERIAELNCRGKEDLYTEPGDSPEIPRGYFSKRADDSWETSIRINLTGLSDSAD